MLTPLIWNPKSAGGHGADLARAAERALAVHDITVRLEPTAGPGGASPLAERLAREGAERILVVGGDGTHSEAADGVLRSGRDVEIGFLPGGTGNDFLLDFGLTQMERAAQRIAAGAPRRIDAGHAAWPGGARHFIDVFGTGFMAKVASYANRKLKRFGPRSYTMAVFPELARLRSPMTRLTLDGRVIDEPLALVAVCNATHMGGGMHVAPMARVDDGLLDIIALRTIGRVGLLRLFPRIFDGSHLGDPRVLVDRAREVRIEPAAPSPLLGDGEIYGATPVTARVLPGALRALV